MYNLDLNDSSIFQPFQSELPSSTIFGDYPIHEQFNNSNNIDVSQNNTIKESKKNNENLNNIFEDKENNTTGDLTKKKTKRKNEKENKIFDIKKENKRGRERIKGDHPIHTNLYLDNIMKANISFIFNIIIKIFNYEFKLSQITCDDLNNKKLLKLAPNEINKTKKDDNKQFINKKLKDILTGDVSKKYKKNNEKNKIKNNTFYNKLDNNNDSFIKKNNNKEFINKLYEIYEKGEENDKEKIKPFINFFEMKFIKFWMIISEYIKSEDDELCIEKKNILKDKINENNDIINNIIIRSIINNINNEIDNHLQKKKYKNYRDYKVIFKLVLKDFIEYINNKDNKFKKK